MVGSFAVGVVSDLEEASGSSGVIDFLAAWFHLLWGGKGSIFEAFIYGMILVLLFGERVKNARRKKRIG